MPEIILVRHGKTGWSRTGRHTGRTDVALTLTGARQARALAGQFTGRRFGRVLTSPKRRAVDTCRLAGLYDSAEVRGELAEWDYGTYEGLTTGQVRRQRPGWLLWRDGAAGGEDAEAVAARVAPLLAQLRAARDDVVIFSHGHLLRVLTAGWLGLPAADGALFALATATVSRLGREHETAVILSWNQPSQPEQGCPTSFGCPSATTPA